MLELALRSMSDDHGGAERQDQVRKMAFQGNCAIFGIAAKAQLGLTILSPNADDPAWIDIAQIGGLIGFRRLRPDARWVLFQQAAYNDDGTPMQNPAQPIIRDPQRPDSWVMREFCSTPTPELNILETPTGRQYELTGGTVGNTGALTCIYGRHNRAFGSIYRDAHNRRGELVVNLVTPAEQVHTDVLVHEQFASKIDMQCELYSRLADMPVHDCPQRERGKLPFDLTPRTLGPGLAALATPTIRDYPALVRRVMDELDLDASAYRAYRLTMPYPPIPTMLLFAFDLPERPASS